MNSQTYDPWDDVQLSPEDNKKMYDKNPKKDAWDEIEVDETWGKSVLRTLSQVPIGIAEGSTYGVLTNLSNLIALGDVTDPEEMDRIKAIAEREGVPFNEEAYQQAAEMALGSFPTPGNIARLTEEATGAPLEAKTRLQKGLRFGSAATKLAPENYTLRPLNVSLPKPVLGAGVAGTKELLQETGVPEPISELASFAILKKPTQDATLSIGKSQKPSGLISRRYEDLKEPVNVSEKKINKINDKIKTDFKQISDKIIAESPAGEVFENLKNDPSFKNETRELLSESQKIADSLPGKYSTQLIKTELADVAKRKKGTGYLASEYEKNYEKNIKDMIKETSLQDISPGDWVRQYRKNNLELEEYFQPGQSKAVNRAKRDALLDHNVAIANVMEKVFPESELVTTFKEGNKRWSQIMDAELIDSFVDDIFGEKIDFNKIHNFFDKEGYSRPFKRALGEKGLRDFENLLKDMSTNESAYKMLKVAEKQGWGSLLSHATAYAIHPKIGHAKLAFAASKKAYRSLLNALLDKPKLVITYKRAFEELKKGDFKAATRDFEILDKEVKNISVESMTKEEALKRFNDKRAKKSSHLQNQKQNEQS